MAERNVTQMPRPQNIPAPPPRPNVQAHQVYADEALKSAQRIIDMMQEIDRLGQELEEWRRRAAMAESEVKRLEGREANLQQQLDSRTRELIDERDSYRFRLNSLVAQFETAGNIILKCMEVSRKDADSRNIVDVNLLEQQVQEELPKVVTAGPRKE
jgi:DNA repair exonuclease SbcCD ATPase subunit